MAPRAQSRSVAPISASATPINRDRKKGAPAEADAPEATSAKFSPSGADKNLNVEGFGRSVR